MCAHRVSFVRVLLLIVVIHFQFIHFFSGSVSVRIARVHCAVCNGFAFYWNMKITWLKCPLAGELMAMYIILFSPKMLEQRAFFSLCRISSGLQIENVLEWLDFIIRTLKERVR